MIEVEAPTKELQPLVLPLILSRFHGRSSSQKIRLMTSQKLKLLLKLKLVVRMTILRKYFIFSIDIWVHRSICPFSLWCRRIYCFWSSISSELNGNLSRVVTSVFRWCGQTFVIVWYCSIQDSFSSSCAYGLYDDWGRKCQRNGWDASCISKGNPCFSSYLNSSRWQDK